MLGEDDRRVPPAQGKEFYKALKARGVKVRWETDTAIVRRRAWHAWTIATNARAVNEHVFEVTSFRVRSPLLRDYGLDTRLNNCDERASSKRTRLWSHFLQSSFAIATWLRAWHAWTIATNARAVNEHVFEVTSFRVRSPLLRDYGLDTRLNNCDERASSKRTRLWSHFLQSSFAIATWLRAWHAWTIATNARAVNEHVFEVTSFRVRSPLLRDYGLDTRLNNCDERASSKRTRLWSHFLQSSFAIATWLRAWHAWTIATNARAVNEHVFEVTSVRVHSPLLRDYGLDMKNFDERASRKRIHLWHHFRHSSSPLLRDYGLDMKKFDERASRKRICLWSHVRGLERKLSHIISRHPSFQFLPTWRYFVAELRDYKPVRGRLWQVLFAKSHQIRIEIAWKIACVNGPLRDYGLDMLEQFGERASRKRHHITFDITSVRVHRHC